jgi:hypothetical protein
MNLQDLMSKLQAIEEGVDAPVDECGGMPVAIGHAEQPKQQDNVTMNISMNGSGSGGIKDLMAILRDIEQGGGEHDDVVFGEPGAEHDEGEPMIDLDMEEEYANSPDTHTSGIEAVTATGDDMASKGHAHPRKVNGGENPMQEGLTSRLRAMYEEIKGEPIEEASDKKTMSRAAKGNEKYGKDGMKELAKAGREGASEKELDAIRDKHDNYNESINESADILKLAKMLRG